MIFNGCTKLASVTLPTNPGFTTIAVSDFLGCSALTSITIPASVTSIGATAFQNSGLTSLTLPANLKTIGDQAFYNTKIAGTVTIPASLVGTTSPAVPGIGSGSFGNCEFLTAINVDAGNGTYLSINGVVYSPVATPNTIVAYPEGKGYFDLSTMPAGVVNIGPGAFWGYNPSPSGTPANTIIITSNITGTIGANAFQASFTNVQFIGTPTIANANSFFYGSNAATVTWANSLKQAYEGEPTKTGMYTRSSSVSGSVTTYTWVRTGP